MTNLASLAAQVADLGAQRPKPLAQRPGHVGPSAAASGYDPRLAGLGVQLAPQPDLTEARGRRDAAGQAVEEREAAGDVERPKATPGASATEAPGGEWLRKLAEPAAVAGEGEDSPLGGIRETRDGRARVSGATPDMAWGEVWRAVQAGRVPTTAAIDRALLSRVAARRDPGELDASVMRRLSDTDAVFQGLYAARRHASRDAAPST